MEVDTICGEIDKSDLLNAGFRKNKRIIFNTEGSRKILVTTGEYRFLTKSGT